MKQLNFIYNNSGVLIITIYIPSGSIYENIGCFKDKNVSGISHFIEHLLFKRTQKYTGKEVLENFTKLGGFYNASTDKDQTLFYVKTLVDNYALAVDLLYEVVLRPRFKRNEVIVERKVVLEELSQTKDDYQDILYQGSNESVLRKDNIYLPPVIGKKKHLTKIHFDTLWKYYCSMFKNFQIVVNCDHQHKKEIKKYILSKILKNKERTVNFYEPQLETLSSLFSHKVLVEVQNTVQYNSCLTFVSYPYKDVQNNLTLDFVKFFLTDAGLYSVLSYAIREKRGLVYSIKSSNEKMRYLGLFKIYFGTSNKDLVSILEVITDILKELHITGLKEDMLLFYKTSYLNHIRYRFTSEEYRATWYGNNCFYGVDLTENDVIMHIKNISNDNIKHVCHHVFNLSNMSIYTFGNYTDTKILQKKLQNIYSIA